MQFQGFLQVGERLLLSLALAGNVNLKTPRNVPIAFAPHRCRKWTFHDWPSYTGPQVQPTHMQSLGALPNGTSEVIKEPPKPPLSPADVQDAPALCERTAPVCRGECQ